MSQTDAAMTIDSRAPRATPATTAGGVQMQPGSAGHAGPLGGRTIVLIAAALIAALSLLAWWVSS